MIEIGDDDSRGAVSWFEAGGDRSRLAVVLPPTAEAQHLVRSAAVYVRGVRRGERVVVVDADQRRLSRAAASCGGYLFGDRSVEMLRSGVGELEDGDDHAVMLAALARFMSGERPCICVRADLVSHLHGVVVADHVVVLGALQEECLADVEDLLPTTVVSIFPYQEQFHTRALEGFEFIDGRRGLPRARAGFDVEKALVESWIDGVPDKRVSKYLELLDDIKERWRVVDALAASLALISWLRASQSDFPEMVGPRLLPTRQDCEHFMTEDALQELEKRFSVPSPELELL